MRQKYVTAICIEIERSGGFGNKLSQLGTLWEVRCSPNSRFSTNARGSGFMIQLALTVHLKIAVRTRFERFWPRFSKIVFQGPEWFSYRWALFWNYSETVPMISDGNPSCLWDKSFSKPDLGSNHGQVRRSLLMSHKGRSRINRGDLVGDGGVGV